MASGLKQKIAQINTERDASLQRAEKAERRLDAETGRLEEAERELGEYNRQVDILEGDVEEAESRLKDLQERLTVTDAQAEELQHKARRTLTLSGNDTAKASAMKAKYRVAVRRAEESEAMIQELENKVAVLEQDFEVCEEREQEYKDVVLRNEEQLISLTANARSLQVQTNKASNYGQTLERRVADMEAKVQGEHQRRANLLEEQTDLEGRLEELEDDKEVWRKQYQAVQEEYESSMAELGEL